MPDQRNGLLWGSFVADALSLGPHWIYDQNKIKEHFEPLTGYTDPLPGSYHPNRKAGQFTHYGDQAMTLFKSILVKGRYDAFEFQDEWKMMWGEYDGYIDGATKESLNQLARGRDTGSKSSDFSGASRIAPVLHAHWDASLADQLTAARNQTATTHNHPDVLDAASLLTRVVNEIKQGRSVTDALNIAVTSFAENSLIQTSLLKATALKDNPDAPNQLGLSCDVTEALPTTLWFLITCGDNLKEALVQNAMAGGDSAARAMAIGMITGAAHGKESIPEDWVNGLETKPSV